MITHIRLACRFLLALVVGCGRADRPVAYSVIQLKSQAVLGQPDLDLVDWTLYRQQQGAIVKSRRVLNAALASLSEESQRKLSGDQDPLEWLENHLRVDFRLGNELMRISLEGDHPDEIEAVITAITNAYMAHTQEAAFAGQVRLAERLHRLEIQSLKNDLLSELNKVNRELARRLNPSRADAVRLGYLLYIPDLPAFSDSDTSLLPVEDLEARLNQLRNRASELQREIDQLQLQ